MPRLLVRIATFVLLPCLLADPSLASAIRPGPPLPTSSQPVILQTQALVGRLVMAFRSGRDRLASRLLKARLPVKLHPGEGIEVEGYRVTYPALYALLSQFERVGLVLASNRHLVFSGFDRTHAQAVIIKVSKLQQTPGKMKQLSAAMRSDTENPPPAGSVPVLLTDGVLSDGQPYQVVDYFSGQTLEEYYIARRAPLSLSDSLKVFQKILDVVEWLHDHHIIHTDLKPENIIVRLRWGKVVAVRVIDVDATAFGTPPFTRKEDFVGHLEPQLDVYSLGVLLTYLLTGGQRKDSYQRFLKMDQFIDRHIRDPRLREILHKATAADRGKRYQSVAELRAALKPFEKGNTFTHERRLPFAARRDITAALLVLGLGFMVPKPLKTQVTQESAAVRTYPELSSQLLGPLRRVMDHIEQDGWLDPAAHAELLALLKGLRQSGRIVVEDDPNAGRVVHADPATMGFHFDRTQLAGLLEEEREDIIVHETVHLTSLQLNRRIAINERNRRIQAMPINPANPLYRRIIKEALAMNTRSEAEAVLKTAEYRRSRLRARGLTEKAYLVDLDSRSTLRGRYAREAASVRGNDYDIPGLSLVRLAEILRGNNAALLEQIYRQEGGQVLMSPQGGQWILSWLMDPSYYNAHEHAIPSDSVVATPLEPEPVSRPWVIPGLIGLVAFIASVICWFRKGPPPDDQSAGTGQPSKKPSKKETRSGLRSERHSQNQKPLLSAA